MGGRVAESTTVVVLILVACVLAATVAPAAVAGSVDGGAAAIDAGAPAIDADPSTTDAVDREAIGPGIQSSTGTVEIVVRFGDSARFEQQTVGEGRISTADLKTNANSSQAEFKRFANGNGAITVERSFWVANAMLVTVDTDRVPIDRILHVRGVERVHQNFEVELDSATSTAGAGASSPMAPSLASPTPTAQTVSTASTDTTYGVEMVRAPEVWNTFETRGAGATVAVLDTGIDPDHPDLNVSGWAEIDENGDVNQSSTTPYDLNGHGTHVAGTVAGGNASGTAIGVAPEATLHGIKVFPGDERSAKFSRIIGGIEASLDPAVVGEQADVVHMSLGADGYHDQFIDPVRNARETGAIVVVSSGNSGQGTSSTPGNVHDSLAVGAVDSSRTVASFSSGETVNTSEDWGSDAPSDWPDEYVVPDVSAPGVDVNSSLPGDDPYGTKSGTSMAAPHVSGVAALMLSASSGTVSDGEIYDILRDTANHPEDATDPDDRYGTGIVDGLAAVSEVRPYYRVSNLSTASIVERNATLEATANVTNGGGVSGVNRTVELRLTNPDDGTNATLNETNVSLGAGNATAVTLNGTVPDDFPTGEMEVAIVSPEENETAPIRVAEAVGTVNGR